MERKILQVDRIELVLLKSNPPRLVIIADGTVPTMGWREPRLVEYVYIQPPPDGIYDFDFVAEAPEELVPQVLQPITTCHVRLGNVDEIKGVRIHASSNTKEEHLQ